MAILDIININGPGGEILTRPAKHVRDFGPDLHNLLDNMFETMRESHGAGLAAPQIGLSQRIAVLEWPEDEDNPDETMRSYEIINPKILRARGSEVGQEGCLSIPGLAADVDRATQVTVRAQDRHGKEVRIKAYGWLARIFQHEIDHLDGKLMLEKAQQVYRLQENEEGEIEAVPIEETLSVD